MLPVGGQLESRPRAAARIGEHDVEPAVARRRVVDDALQLLGLADVEHRLLDVVAGGLQPSVTLARPSPSWSTSITFAPFSAMTSA